MQHFLSFDPNAMVYNRQYSISDAMPGVARIGDVYVAGPRGAAGGNFLERLSGGAFDAEGRLVEAVLQPRSEEHHLVEPGQRRVVPASCSRIARAVFGGFALDHFGHFLLEATARLWALPEYRDLPWIFLTDGRRSALKSYQQGFLELLGLPASQVVVVSDWLAVDELIVPEPSFTYHNRVTHAYRDTFRRAAVPGPARPGRRIFLSRSETKIARTIGEQELEAMLQRGGWEVVFPEQLPPVEQARLFRDDNVLLGLQGSAMHLGLFGLPGREVTHLCRGQGYRGYYILDDLMEAEATYFLAMAQPALESKPITGPFLLDLDRTVDFLRERGYLAQAAVTGAGLSASEQARLCSEYEAWWHYTESQIRLHAGIDHSGAPAGADAALEAALVALELLPGDRDMLRHACALLLRRGDGVGAEALLSRHAPALGSDGGATVEDAPLLHLRSMVRDTQSDHEGALIDAMAAEAAAPGNPDYTNQRATLLYRLDRLDEAETVLRPLLEPGRGGTADRLLHSLLLDRKGAIEAAIGAAREAAAMDPDNAGLGRHLIGLLRRAGKPAAAAEVLEALLDRGGADVPMLLELAELERARGRLPQASQAVEAAHERAPEDPAAIAAYVADHTERGLFPDLKRLGQAQNEAVQEQSVMVYRRSLALAEAGRTEEALFVAVMAVALNPHNGTILTNLLSLMLQRKQPRDAKLLIDRLVDAGHGTGELFYLLSLAEGDLGRGAAAREASLRAMALAPENPFVVEHHRRLHPAV